MRIFALLLSMLPASALAQSPHEPWRTVETEHFRIHSPLAAEAWSLEAAKRFEDIHAVVTAEVGHTPRQVVDVVVIDPYGRANGFAIPTLRTPRMGVFTTAPGAASSIGNYHSWVEELVVHEEVHLVHMLRPSRNAAGFLTTSLLGVGPVALKSPMWVIEGYATMLEGRLTGAGRPNGDLRASLLRAMAREGRLPSYRQLNGSQRYLGRAMPYLVGSAFMEWLAERQGEDAMRALWARMTSRRIRGFKTAFEGVFGDPPELLYERFCAELSHAALQIERQLPEDEGTLWQDLSRGTGRPAVSPDGLRLAVVEQRQDKPPRLLVLGTEDDGEARREWQERVDRNLARDPQDVAPLPPEVFPKDPEAQRVHGGRSPSEPRWLPDGQALLFTAWQRDAQGDWRPDLFTWQPDSGRERRVTRGAQVRDADPAPDGSWAVARRQRWGASQLVRVDLASGQVSDLTEPDIHAVHDSPRISPDGTRLLYLRNAGTWQLVLRDLDDGQEQLLPLPDGSSLRQPAWSADGQSIFVSLGRGGLLEVWRLPLDGAAPQQITHSHGLALAPEPTPDGEAVFYLTMDSKGLDLRRLELGAALSPVELSEAPALPVLRPPPAAAAQLELRPLEREPRSYGLGRLEARPLLGGVTAAGLDTMDLGLRLGDLLGRWELLTLASIGHLQGATGGSSVLALRVLPVELQLQGFASSEGGGAQRAGGALDLSLERQLPWGRAGMGLAAWLDRPWGEGGEDGRGAGQARAWFQDFAWLGRAWAGLQAEGLFQLGRTGDAPWRMGSGGLGLSMGWDAMGLALGYDLCGTDAQGELDRLQLGGMDSALWPRAYSATRIFVPVLAPGSASGQGHDELHASLGALGSLELFAQRHRLWEDWQAYPYSEPGGAASLVGLSVKLPMPSQPLVRLPAMSWEAGMACIVEDPQEGLRSRPCRALEDYASWIGLVWRP